MRLKYGCLSKSRSGGASAEATISGGTTGFSPRTMDSSSCCAVTSLRRGMFTMRPDGKRRISFSTARMAVQAFLHMNSLELPIDMW